MDFKTIILLVLAASVIWVTFTVFKKSNKDIDPEQEILAEAEVYIAYGLYKQAITHLEKAIVEHPTNMKFVEKLNEIREKHT